MAGFHHEPLEVQNGFLTAGVNLENRAIKLPSAAVGGSIEVANLVECHCGFRKRPITGATESMHNRKGLGGTADAEK